MILSDVVNDLWDVQQVFETIAGYCRPESRIILNSHSRLWEVPRRVRRRCADW